MATKFSTTVGLRRTAGSLRRLGMPPGWTMAERGYWHGPNNSYVTFENRKWWYWGHVALCADGPHSTKEAAMRRHTRPSSATRPDDMNKPMTQETNPERPTALAAAPCSASGLRPPDCAAIGGPTISRMRGCINDEMKECIICGNACRWDMTEHSFFGFAAACPQKPNIVLCDTAGKPKVTNALDKET